MPCAISLRLSLWLIFDLGEPPTGEIVFSSCIYFGVCWLVAALSPFEISLFVTVGIIPGSRICILDVCVSRILCSAGDFAAVLNVTQCIDYDLKYFRTPLPWMCLLQYLVALIGLVLWLYSCPIDNTPSARGIV